jgi:hypothetical protein
MPGVRKAPVGGTRILARKATTKTPSKESHELDDRESDNDIVEENDPTEGETVIDTVPITKKLRVPGKELNDFLRNL